MVFGGKRDKRPSLSPQKRCILVQALKTNTSFVDNETIGGIIRHQGLNDAADEKIDDGDIPVSNNEEYYGYPWGRPEKQFTKSQQQHPSRASLFWAT